MKKLIVFDFDGTLTESKSDLSEDMANALARLLDHYSVGVISGCSYKQFEQQFLSHMRHVNLMALMNLFLLPTCGSRMYGYELHGGYVCMYHNDLTLREKVYIYNVWQAARDMCGIQPPEQTYGEVAEDRRSQVTFSMCGQEAPLEIKLKWDPDGKKRLNLAKYMQVFLSGFEVKVGGTTSIDVTRDGIDKAYGLEKLMEHVEVSTDDVLFIGDALYEGGNDSVVKQTGVECKQVSGPSETLELIKELITTGQNKK
jgi:HAD superfamily hydrolase (TIGR01484 family)